MAGIIDGGTEKQRKAALQTLQLDQSFRLVRTGASAQARPFRQARRRFRQGSRSAREIWLGSPWGVQAEDGLKPAQDRTIYTAGQRSILPGKVVREEGVTSAGDQAVDEAYVLVSRSTSIGTPTDAIPSTMTACQ